MNNVAETSECKLTTFKVSAMLKFDPKLSSAHFCHEEVRRLFNFMLKIYQLSC